MPIAEILTIGTEILLGEIQDTNTAFLARAIKDLGIDLYRTQTVGDNSARITSVIREILSRADLVITTGGLGPTVDDPTRQAVADAFDVPLVFSDECWDQIQAYFTRVNRPIPENNRRQAYIPSGALVIPNPVGTAPAFIVDTGEKILISVPGVPKEMEYLMLHNIAPYLQQRWINQNVIHTRTIHTVGMGEAVLDDLIGHFETWTNPTVGLLAKSGIVDIRVGAKAETSELADRMIQDTIDQIIPKLGKHVFGFDDTSLPLAVRSLIDKVDLPIQIKIQGFDPESITPLMLISSPSVEILQKDTISEKKEVQTSKESLEFLATINTNTLPIEFSGEVKLPGAQPVIINRRYGGPPEMARTWAVNNLLDLIRLTLMDIVGQRG